MLAHSVILEYFEKNAGWISPPRKTHSKVTLSYTSPWSSIALATFRKPPMLAPFTRLPGVP